MKRQSRHRILIAASVLLIMTASGRADIVTMKNGDKHEGKILSETADSIEMEYKLTAKIKDRKVFMKADIADIKKQTASEVEFAERNLAKLLPTADLLSGADYETMIQDKLRTFAAKYPGTPETAEVEKIIKELADEKSKVLSGQLKVDGRWLDAATVKRDAYDIDGYRQRVEMNRKAAENTDTRYLDALRAFEKLRTDFGASTSYVKAIPEAQEILKKFEIQLNSMLAEAPILLKQRQDGLKALSPAEAPETKRSIEAEERAYRAVADAQNKAKMKWRDIYKYDVKGIQLELTAIAKERAELGAIEMKSLQAENDSLLAMIRYMADGNLTEADSIYSKISRDSNAVINKPLMQKLGKQLSAMKLAAKKALKPGLATPAAAATTPDATTDGSNPVAEALKKIQAEREAKAAAGTKKSGPAAATGTTDKKAAPPAGTATAAPKPAAAPAPPPPEPTMMETITGYVPFIGGGLLAVLLAAMFISKKKKKDD